MDKKASISKETVKSKKWVYSLLILILLLSIVLRLWGIKFGLPHIFYIDSTKIVKRAKRIGKNIVHGKWDIDPKFYQYPTFLTNLLALEYVVYAIGYGIVSQKTGKHQTMEEAIDTLFRNQDPAYLYDPYPPIFYLLARLTNAVAGILTVLLCFYLAKIAFKNDDRIALLSAFFLSVMFIHTKHSKYPMADTVLAFWTTAAMIYVVQIIFRGDLKDYLLSGLFIGLGTSTKYLTVFLTASFMLNAGYQWWQNHKDKIKSNKILFYTILGLAMIFVGFLIGTPTFLTRYREFIGMARRERRGMGSATRGGKYGNTQTWFLDYFFNTQPSWFEPLTFNSLWGAMGIPLLLLSSLAFIYFIYKGISKDKREKPIYWDFILFLAIFYCFIAGRGKNRIARYFVIAVPFTSVMASKFFVDIMDKIHYVWIKTHRNILLAGLAILIALPTTVRTIRYNHLMTHTNNRIIAGRWIESHIPEGSKLYMPILYPPVVSQKKYKVSFYKSQQRTDKNVIPYRFLKQKGIDYIILSSYDYGPSYSKEALRDYPEGTLALLQFYREAEEDAEWVKIFESNLVNIPGPTIKVIKVRK